MTNIGQYNTQVIERVGVHYLLFYVFRIVDFLYCSIFKQIVQIIFSQITAISTNKDVYILIGNYISLWKVYVLYGGNRGKKSYYEERV